MTQPAEESLDAASIQAIIPYLIHRLSPYGLRMPPSRRPGEQNGGGLGSATVTETRPKLQKPSLYRVLILNDDYTPMEFVIYVLERFFQKDREVAETKVAQVIETARRHQHPLQCTMEKD